MKRLKKRTPLQFLLSMSATSTPACAGSAQALRKERRQFRPDGSLGFLFLLSCLMLLVSQGGWLSVGNRSTTPDDAVGPQETLANLFLVFILLFIYFFCSHRSSFFLLMIALTIAKNCASNRSPGLKRHPRHLSDNIHN